MKKHENEHIEPRQLAMFALRQKVWAKPSTPDDRPYFVEFLHRQIDYARALTTDELLRGKGSVSSSICGALIWPSVAADDGIGWLTEESEPELSRILDITCELDVDDNDQAAWDELFQIVDKLQ